MIRLLQSAWTSSGLGVLAFCATLFLCWKPEPPPAAATESETIASGPSWTFQNPEVDMLVDELKKQKEALATREKELNQLAIRLESERAELGQLTQAVQQVQTEFDRNVTRVTEQESANLKKLAKTYANMTPEGAAAVIKAMDDVTVVKILSVMKETETAPVLDALARQSEGDAKRVAVISEKLRLTATEKKAANL